MMNKIEKVLLWIGAATITFMLWLCLFHFLSAALNGFNAYSASAWLLLLTGAGLLIVNVMKAKKDD